MPNVFIYNKPFELENGKTLPVLKLAYTTYGKLNSDGGNVIWVCHALTADSNVDQWWPDLYGQGRLLDYKEYFIVCVNFLGSCYGSTGASSSEVPESLKRKNFPLVNIADIVKAYQLVKAHLNIKKIQLLIGASLGGQQALHWAVHYPNQIKKLCVLATNAFHSPWGIAFNASQRFALEADKSFRDNEPEGGKLGLKAARSIALLSYRTSKIYNLSQSESSNEKQNHFVAESYQNYQGQKLVERFCPYAYYAISKTMDSHNLGRGFSSVKKALQRIEAKTLCVGIKSDILFTSDEQRYLAHYINDADFIEIDSIYGHDGFLVEGKIINNLILKWFNENPNL
ncbi:homoserine O-acetyltransferase [Flavobacterium sp. CS20]|uniref:homoserine O-acetyltransferase family protein n=1 Tax=Flavobacterium sp. CS20 TaxID=2775246 RepID=UPI001B39DC25|nr:homoserine O-acetyltransferase [Flavobacterium sp. CS20]QTY27823.1 homoserine O-acetyltransferase [Flavobacterium sp. CS20]